MRQIHRVEAYLSFLKFGRALKALAGPELRVQAIRRRDMAPLRVGFARRDDTLVLSVASDTILVYRELAIERVSGLVHILKHCRDDIAGIADISDGEHDAPGVVSMCSRLPDSIQIPDAEFLNSHGYRDLRDAAAAARPFRERADVVLWRGATTGNIGRVAAPGMTSETPELIQRTRMCLKLRDVAGCDVRFSDVVQSDQPQEDRRLLDAAGIMGEPIGTASWADVRYHIAIDGNGPAWSSTFTRLLLGCCVLKQEAVEGLRQWYAHRLVAWRHYVPIAYDLGDLVEKIAWCRANADEAAAIADRGQRLASSMTYESELDAARQRLDTMFAAGQMRTEPVTLKAAGWQAAGALSLAD
jgi:hypothetical protein